MTMSEGTTAPPLPAPPPAPDPNDLTFLFDPEEWLNLPSQPTGRGVRFKTDERYRREAHAHAYRQYGTKGNWLRYLTLGLYAFEDCKEYDKLWTTFNDDPLQVHRAIWYNFMFHVDNEIEIPTQLNEWAMQISHAYLSYYDPTSLELDTRKSWADLQIPVEVDMMDTQDEWIPVNHRRRAKSPPAVTGEITQNETKMHPNNAHGSFAPGFNLPTDAGGPPVKHNTSVTNESTTDESYRQDSTMTSESTMTKASKGNTKKVQAPLQPGYHHPPRVRPDSHPMLKTNDGTHRITVKWKLLNSDTTLIQRVNDRSYLDEEIFKLLQQMFQDQDGHFYRWESEDLVQAKLMSQMTPSEAREFISPNITVVNSSGMLVFGVRFGFTTNPIRWRQQIHFQETVKTRNITVSVSNSCSTSGKLVIAGYILLKAPNTTHKHRYTQHLLSKLPDATPFFDVLRLSRSPMDQVIPHLAIQCGEKHVIPLCQALLKYLTGGDTALFLPRYALTTMTDEKIKQHFEFHETWAKSLQPVEMAPTISHLDQLRNEYMDDGTVLTRSTREWAASLTLLDGMTPALCDVVNGTSDHKAYLVAPRHYLEIARTQWQSYRTRLFPPRHRETRFRDNLQGLPDVIHITTSIQSNVAFLEQMSAVEVWTHAPPSVREAPLPNHENTAIPRASSAPRPQKKPRRRSSAGAATTFRSSVASSCESIPEEPESDSSDDESSRSLNRSDEEVTPAYAATDERSTDSTQSSTRASDKYQTKFQELEKILRSQQKALDSSGKLTTDRLSQIERQLFRIEDMDTKISALSDQLSQAATSTVELTNTVQAIRQHTKESQKQAQEYQNQSDQKIDTLGNTVVKVMTTMLEMRAQFEQMSTFMQEMASKTESNMLEKTSKGHGKRDRSNTQNLIAQQTGKSSAEHPVSGDNSISSDSRASDASSQSTSCFHSPQKKKLHSVPNSAEEEDQHTTQRNTMGESTQDMTMEQDDDDDQELMPFPNGRVNLQNVFSASSEGPTQLVPEIEIQPPSRILPSNPLPIGVQNSDGLDPDSSTEQQEDDRINAPLTPQYNFPGSDGATKK